MLTRSGAASGGPGALVSYDYTWDHDCAVSNLQIVVVWDDSAATVIGTVPVVAPSKPCQGTVTGSLPRNATAGLHYPSAHVQGRTAPVTGSAATAAQGQGFDVILPPTPTPNPSPTATPNPTPTATATPTPTPTPTASDTPLPTDTPTDVAVSPSPISTATPGASGALAITAGNTGSSGPPGGSLLVGVLVALVIAAAGSAAVLLWRQRARRGRNDPFEFLR